MTSDREREEALDHARTVTRETSATPEEVWAVLADGWLYPAWVVGASRMRAVGAAWPAPGARLHHSVGTWPALLDDETVALESEEPSRLRLQAKGRPAGEAVVEIAIVRTPTGSTLTIREDVVSGPMLAVPRPGRQLGVVPRNVETLRRLALLAEAADEPGDGPAS